ncbi:hypothetical protein SPSIL_011600 [Sporomusa silvacetica DSM 10669]|uniref:Serine aminopeptidase S33 domain-containing protein n=1 Tax=Sporomusa silvacetica DSM 10669 TaxID=1123289 RepID=A0ABZ3IHA5_9FIRM|nr:alpha/beta fold hydrolase [Sporomusa silvacetica]OZC14887.1 putative lysophospholipase [Sporomusa silvacetica DSM 10669]
MEPIDFIYESHDDVSIYARQWPVEKEKIKGVIQVAHGLGETADYYQEFSENAIKAGFAVYINEARGHGRTAGDITSPNYREKAGDIGENGFAKMKEDLHAYTGIIQNQYPVIPIFLLGHSMGSAVARLYAFDYGSEINGLITTGTLFDSLELDYLLQIAAQEIKERGLKAPCQDT